jgi:uncharacterized protein (TIGR02145 family)
MDQETLTDIDGNIYKTIKVGEQIWMAENLKVGHFRNGDAIRRPSDGDNWRIGGDSKNPYWVAPYDDSDFEQTYGKYYNWHAVNDSRGLAPVGWHVPSDAEWTKLIDFLGGTKLAGIKMKSDSFWPNDNNGNNASGFSALPAGHIDWAGTFYKPGKESFWWTTTPYKKNVLFFNQVLVIEFCRFHQEVIITHYKKFNGFSVRCIKD